MRAARAYERPTDPIELFPSARVVAAPEVATAKGDRLVLETKLDRIAAEVRIGLVLSAAALVVAVLR